MTAYSYNQDGYYTGQTNCQRDPVRSKAAGGDVYLTPAAATLTPPPDFDSDTQLCRWDGAQWSLEDKPAEPEPEPIPAPAPTNAELAEENAALKAQVEQQQQQLDEQADALIELAAILTEV